MKFKLVESHNVAIKCYNIETGVPGWDLYSPSEYGIDNYIVNSQGSISVFNVNDEEQGNVVMGLSGCTYIPFDFEYVEGYFDISYNKLKSLQGCPRYVKFDFNCRWSLIKSLEGGPKYVGGNYDCGANDLNNLEGGPKYVGGKFNISGNKRLTDLKGSPISLQTVAFEINFIDDRNSSEGYFRAV